MRRSYIIIGIIVVVVLAAGIAALYLWPEPAAEQEPDDDTIVAADDNNELINETRDDVSRIDFTPLEGAPYSISFDVEEKEYEFETADAVFPGSESVMRSIYASATTLINLTRVIDEADDEQLDMFGFNEPVMIIKVNLIDETYRIIEVGGMQVAGRARYARLQNSREIFLLSERHSTLLTQGVNEVYDISFIPLSIFPDIETLVFGIDLIHLETGDEIFEIRKRSEEELIEGGLGTSAYQIMQPLVAEGNDYMIQNTIMENVFMISPESIESIRPQDLTIYGLDEPSRLTLESELWSGTLLVGARDIERDGRFIMIEGHDAVLFDSTGDYSFLNINISRLRSSLIWLHSISDISFVSFDLEGTTRVLRMEHYMDEDDKERVRGWLDDVEISETNARRLYMSALSVTQTGETNENIPAGASPAYSISMHKTDGSVHTMELYSLNESQFLIAHNGTSTGFLITRMSLQQNLLGRFEILDAGGDLPAS